jgi:hypothetical protein
VCSSEEGARDEGFFFLQQTRARNEVGNKMNENAIEEVSVLCGFFSHDVRWWSLS